jgi:tRNA (cytidine/uridine-2'-O-)-methyltransferase
MLHCVLYQPEIPPNTGNIIRLCANSGVQLHLIHPLGFSMEDKYLRRAGLDYYEFANIQQYTSLEEFLQKLQPKRLFACSTKGQQFYHQVSYQAGDTFIFGPETRGLPVNLLNILPPETIIKIPMREGNRSLNLANSVGIILYEAWRQLDFK